MWHSCKINTYMYICKFYVISYHAVKLLRWQYINCFKHFAKKRKNSYGIRFIDRLVILEFM